LRESEGKYRQIVEHAPSAIYEIDLTNGNFISANDVTCEYLECTKEELLNLNFTDVLTEESLLKNLERWQKIQNGEEVPAIQEYEFIGKNKRRLWGLFNTKIVYEGDKPVRVTVIAHDITNRKLIEQEISKAQQLESLGVLAGGIGHDFNNLLSGIMGNISLAKLEAERGENIMESLDEALRVSSKASALTQQLLVFSKGGAPVKKAASIVEVLRDSAAFSLRGSKVKFEFGIAEDLWPIKVDVGQFSQVIQNLVINALQAMPKGGKITLGAKNVNLETVTEIPLTPGRYVEITIQDQGKGIAPGILPKIFDPYFTTKSKGSGLGLTMSYTIIKRHDGHITVESEVGKGSVFRIFLPATEELPEETAITENRAVKGEGRILVMDDEEILRKVAKRMLLELGYEVACVEDGAEAIELYAKTKGSKQTFDAVIMDLTIPGGMGGKEAIEKLLEVDPEAIVVVSSGYSNDPIMSSYETYGFRGVVTKPYRIEQLSWVLRDVLRAGK
jgi:two-component system cell cycle sensor histidine kinase/response regulator CckA